MKPLVLVFLALLLSVSGCVTSSNPYNHDRVELIEVAPEVAWLEINHIQWIGINMHGYDGFRTTVYWAKLVGSGPTFTNPEFKDSFRCIGTITLDREHHRAIINMRRIRSQDGEPLRTEAHPANGTYRIELLRKYQPGDPGYYLEPGNRS